MSKFAFGIVLGIFLCFYYPDVSKELLLYYTNPKISLLDNLKKKVPTTKRSIYISPKKKWTISPFFGKNHYYKQYDISLKGNDIGFPDDTSIQIVSKINGIVKINSPKMFRLKTYNGEDATLWNKEDDPQSSVVLFIDGPGKNILGTLSVTILSIGSPIPDDAIQIVSDSRDNFETLVFYNTNVKWER